MRFIKIGCRAECLILFGSLLFTSCLQPPEELSPYPDIKFAETTWDFGEIEAGAKVDYVYEFKNAGRDTLRITKVRKGCGCQSAEATRKVIPPGEKAGIKVMFDSRGYRGEVRKRVFVHSNDPEQEKLTLEMKGVVLVDLIVRPRSVNFMNVPIGKTPTKEVHVVPKMLEKLEIKNIEVSADYITVTTSDYMVEGKNGVEISITLGRDAPPGIVIEKVTISTNSEKTPLIQIPVHANISNKIAIQPRTLHFRLKPGESKKYEISVFIPDQKNFRMTKVEDDIDDIDTELFFLSEKENTQIYEIEIKVKPTASPGSYRGEFTFYPREAQQSLLQKMRVNGVVE